MDEYIKREEAMNIAFKSPFFSDSLMEEIMAIPAEDVTPVRHGRWMPAVHVGDCCYRCSECQFLRDAYLIDIGNYCPNCGAKMDLEG